MDITIEKLVYGGEGLAHHEGAAVFVPYVLPGERVGATAWEQKKKFIRARLDRTLEASPERVAPPCPHFGVCGGCDYQHIPYEAQVRFKTEILRETLRRIGRIDWPGEIGVHPSPPWGYRNRAQWKIRPLAEPAPRKSSRLAPAAEEKLGMGYFRAGSATLCAIESCAILSPLLAKSLGALRSALEIGELPRTLREIEAFAGANGAALLVNATFAGFPARPAELEDKLRGLLPEMESLLFHDPSRERMELHGPGYVTCEAGGRTYRVGHFSFFQVNRFLVGELAREVAQGEERGGLALDLFAGAGLFSLPLTECFDRVVAVEENPAAARDLEVNAGSGGEGGIRGPSKIEIHAVDAERYLERCTERPALVVLDPPRAGLTPGILKHLVRIGPAGVTYVSCDPPTLARDLAAFAAAGYAIREIRLFDMFPQTFHIETVVRLRRLP